MGMFNNSTKETKEFESIILDIEKEKDTISWCHTTIQSCLWDLENPKVERWKPFGRGVLLPGAPNPVT